MSLLKKRRYYLIVLLALLIVIGVFVIRSEVTHRAILALIEPYMEKATDDWHSLMADDLRPKSIAERRRFLETLRADLESEADPDDTEFLEIFINNFIRAMNERGVYFE